MLTKVTYNLPCREHPGQSHGLTSLRGRVHPGSGANDRQDRVARPPEDWSGSTLQKLDGCPPFRHRRSAYPGMTVERTGHVHCDVLKCLTKTKRQFWGPDISEWVLLFWRDQPRPIRAWRRVAELHGANASPLASLMPVGRRRPNPPSWRMRETTPGLSRHGGGSPSRTVRTLRR